MATDTASTPPAPPLAAGVRIGWADLPEPVRGWVETTLGSPVRSSVSQVGGFSPGVAARLVTADGSRAFVKAVGAELNEDSVGLHRRELAALEVAAADAGRGESMIHLDVRSDNVLITSRDGAVLVDWAWGSRGAPWLDVVILLINVSQYGPHTPAELDDIVAAHPLTRAVDPWLITLIVLGMTGLLESRGRAEPPPALPTIRTWQRHAALGAGRWLRYRLAERHFGLKRG